MGTIPRRDDAEGTGRAGSVRDGDGLLMPQHIVNKRRQPMSRRFRKKPVVTIKTEFGLRGSAVVLPLADVQELLDRFTAEVNA